MCDAYTTVGDGDTVLHKIQKSIEDEYPSTSREGGRGGRGEHLQDRLFERDVERHRALLLQPQLGRRGGRRPLFCA